MTEPSEGSKYIKCSKCRCKYIYEDEHIKKDFGYNRLEERFKTCVKCRDKDKLLRAKPSDCVKCGTCKKWISKYIIDRHVVDCPYPYKMD